MFQPTSHPPHDSFLRRLGLAVVTTLVLGVMTWVGISMQRLTDSTHSLHETSAINTLKIEQIQSTLQPLPVLTEQVARLRFDVEDLRQRQAKDDAFREAHDAHDGSAPKRWTH